MAEKAAVSAQPPRPAWEGAVAAGTACPARAPDVVAFSAGTPRTRPAEAGALTPQSPIGDVAARVLLRPTGRRSANRDRGRHARHRRRDGDINMRRFGDNLSVGRTENYRLSSYEADFGLSSMDSFDHRMSSSDKENVKPARKRFLDDALFQFFSKEAIKSLKRNFTDFCNESDIWSQNKRLKDHSIGRDAFISYSIKYYWEVLKSLSNRRKEVIRKFGFGCLLLFEKSEIPSSFVRWLVCCVDPVSSQILVDDCKIIPISKDSVHFVTGLPNSGSAPMPNCVAGAKFIMSLFNLSELPHITFFGNKLKSKEVLSEKEVFVCFMIIAFKCFLFPTTDEFPNTDFLHILEEPDAAKGFDICLLVYDHFIAGVHKFLKVCKRSGRKPKEFEFCYYFLAVYYLDSLNFGARILDPSVPRISVWKGNLIKFLCELDYKRNNMFGKRPLKKILPRCYREFGLLGDFKTVNDGSKVFSESPLFSLSFKQNMHMRFGKELDEKIINGIIDSVRCVELGNHDNVHKSELIVSSVLQLLLVSKLSEVKISTTTLSNALGTGNCKPVKPKCAASLHDNMISNFEANTDIASKIDSVNNHEFSQKISSSALGNNLIEVAESPECVMIKATEHCTVSTAPVMHPMKKVKSRLPHSVPNDHSLLSSKTYPANVEGSRSFLNHDSNNGNNDVHQPLSFGHFMVDNNMTYPISRINFSQTLVEKDVSAFLVSKGCPVKKQRCTSSSVSGSKGAPIPVVETSPQLTNKSPEVQISGSNFRLRQVELAKKSDELYNRLINNAGQQGIQQPALRKQTVDSNDNYVDLSQHATEERFKKNDTMIILQPINRLVLPLLQNSRFPVSNLDVKNFCAIVELAYTKGVQKKIFWTITMKFS